MQLRDAIEVNSSPEAIFQFFAEMELHYLRWHPDHKLFRWVSSPNLVEGSVFYFEELIRGKLLRKKVIFTRIVPLRHIEFAPTFWLLRLFLPRMIFRIDELAANRCLLTAEIHLRMGPLAVRLNRRDLDAVREHMRIEGINLKSIVERSSAVGASTADASSAGAPVLGQSGV